MVYHFSGQEFMAVFADQEKYQLFEKVQTCPKKYRKIVCVQNTMWIRTEIQEKPNR
jgi:hypothetical protein